MVLGPIYESPRFVHYLLFLHLHKRAIIFLLRVMRLGSDLRDGTGDFVLNLAISPIIVLYSMYSSPGFAGIQH
jgi:hypothetical protein